MDRAPINLGGIDIECVDELQYLGSSIHHCGCPSDDVDARVAAASSACGTLQTPVFSVRYLDIHIERYVFNACALSLLIYGSECWTRCSMIFADCLPFTCVVFVLFWGLLGHKLGRSACLMLSCLFCGVTLGLL